MMIQVETGKTYVTRDGMHVRVIDTKFKNGMTPVIGIHTDHTGYESVFTYTLEGSFLVNGTATHHDLVKEYIVTPCDGKVVEIEGVKYKLTAI